MMTLLLSIALCFNSLAMASDDISWSAMTMNANEKDILIPQKLKEMIDKRYVDHYRSTEAAQLSTDEDILNKINKAYLEVDFFVQSESPFTLSSNTLFQSARGGGQFSLEDIIVQNKGSMYVSLSVNDPDAKEKDISDYDLFFWSTTPQRQIEDKTYGLKCGTLIELDKKNFQQGKNKGFHINATDSRYKPVVNGHYYFARYGSDRMALAVVKVGSESGKTECLKP